MKRTEIRKLIDVNAFFKDVEEIVHTCKCTRLEAVEEYARQHDLSLEFVASIVRTHKNKVKASLIDECKDLKLISQE